MSFSATFAKIPEVLELVDDFLYGNKVFKASLDCLKSGHLPQCANCKKRYKSHEEHWCWASECCIYASIDGYMVSPLRVGPYGHIPLSKVEKCRSTILQIVNWPSKYPHDFAQHFCDDCITRFISRGDVRHMGVQHIFCKECNLPFKYDQVIYQNCLWVDKVSRGHYYCQGCCPV